MQQQKKPQVEWKTQKESQELLEIENKRNKYQKYLDSPEITDKIKFKEAQNRIRKLIWKKKMINERENVSK